MRGQLKVCNPHMNNHIFNCTATRHCGDNGVWGSVMCMPSEQFLNIENEVRTRLNHMVFISFPIGI